jgi:hypothetical protein
MSIFTLDWFKSNAKRMLDNLKIEEQALKNSLLRRELETPFKPYEKLKLVNDVLTVVLKDGEVLSKPSCTVDDFNDVKNANNEIEIIALFNKKLSTDEMVKEVKQQKVFANISSKLEMLSRMQDFDVVDGSVKLKGINRTMPQLLVEKFIEVISLYQTEDGDPHEDVYNDEQYLSLKRFFMWCCLNPRAEVADELYRFLVDNSFRITKQGFFVALRNVVTLHGSNELVKFVSEVYTKIKAVWKKSPNHYHVILSPDGEYKFMHYTEMTKEYTDTCDTCGGTGDWYDDEVDEYVTCYDCDGEGKVTYTDRNYEGKDLGVLTDLYLDLPNRAENRFTDDWTKTFDIRIGQVVKMPMEDCNWSTQDCAAAGLHFTADQIHYVGCGDQSVLMLINPMKVVGIGTAKGRCYEYLPISTVSRDEATQILHDLDFSTIDLDEFYVENELESLSERAEKAFAQEVKKYEFNIPAISSSEIGKIVNSLKKMKDELGGRVKEVV